VLGCDTRPKYVWRINAISIVAPSDKSFDLFNYGRMSSSSIDETQRPLAKPPPNEPARKPEPPPRRRPSLVQQKSS